MIEFKRATTWDIICNLKIDGTKQDLQGLTVFFTLRPDIDILDTTDTDATITSTVLIPSTGAIYDYTLTIANTATSIPIGVYNIGIQYKMTSGKIYEPFTTKCSVVNKITNRTA
jgi:hypothetical protein